jgi:hypothetical protein
MTARLLRRSVGGLAGVAPACCVTVDPVAASAGDLAGFLHVDVGQVTGHCVLVAAHDAAGGAAGPGQAG